LVIGHFFWARFYLMNDSLFPLLLILRYAHILGAITLMGGTIFMRFALRPVAVGLQPDARAAIHEQVRRRWAKFVMLASALLLISGITNLALAGRYDFEPVVGMSKGYHMVVGLKFLLALPIFFLAALMTGRSSLAHRVQDNAGLWINVNLALALLMVLIGGALKFVQRQPKPSIVAQAPVGRLLDENATKKLPF
jgi:uncharacterized membrane protein